MLVLIDNYDSFTYNLFQYLSELGEEVVVLRNDRTVIEDIERMSPQRIVISPGPSTPENAGISNDVIRYFGAKLPVLGVCLGHQCIGYSYGGVIIQAEKSCTASRRRYTTAGEAGFAGCPPLSPAFAITRRYGSGRGRPVVLK